MRCWIKPQSNIHYQNFKHCCSVALWQQRSRSWWKAYHMSHCGMKFIFQFNTLRPRQNGRHFAEDIFKCIYLNENAWIMIKISMKFVPKGPINNIPVLVQIMAWRRPGDKPLSEPVMVSLTTHICVIQQIRRGLCNRMSQHVYRGNMPGRKKCMEIW